MLMNLSLMRKPTFRFRSSVTYWRTCLNESITMWKRCCAAKSISKMVYKAKKMKWLTYYSTCLSPPFAVCSSRNFLNKRSSRSDY